MFFDIPYYCGPLHRVFPPVRHPKVRLGLRFVNTPATAWANDRLCGVEIKTLYGSSGVAILNGTLSQKSTADLQLSKLPTFL